jgi:hypothetical protein
MSENIEAFKTMSDESWSFLSALRQGLAGRTAALAAAS